MEGRRYSSGLDYLVTFAMNLIYVYLWGTWYSQIGYDILWNKNHISESNKTRKHVLKTTGIGEGHIQWNQSGLIPFTQAVLEVHECCAMRSQTDNQRRMETEVRWHLGSLLNFLPEINT